MWWQEGRVGRCLCGPDLSSQALEGAAKKKDGGLSSFPLRFRGVRKACLQLDLQWHSFQRGWADTVTLPTVLSLCTWCFPEHWAGISKTPRGHQTGFHRTPQGLICQRELEKQYSSWFDGPAHTGVRAEHNVMTLWDRMMLLVGDLACGCEEKQAPGKPFLARISNPEPWWCIYHAKPIPPSPHEATKQESLSRLSRWSLAPFSFVTWQS